jgi:hypothetical protein
MLGILNNKRLFKSNNLLNYSLQSTYKSINEKIEREKKNNIDCYLKQNNNTKIITVKQKLINIITIFSVTSFIFYFINKNK